MIAKHSTTFTARCPVNDSIDSYDISIETTHLIKIEDIIALLATFSDQKRFQEDITYEIAHTLRAKITTIGYHSGIRTEVIA